MLNTIIITIIMIIIAGTKQACLRGGAIWALRAKDL